MRRVIGYQLNIGLFRIVILLPVPGGNPRKKTVALSRLFSNSLSSVILKRKIVEFNTWFRKTFEELSLFSGREVTVVRCGLSFRPYKMSPRSSYPSSNPMLLLSRLFLLFTIYLSASATIVNDILNALKNAVDCTSCKALLTVLKGVAYLGDSTFSDALVTICRVSQVTIWYPWSFPSEYLIQVPLQLEDDDVCQGLFTQQGPIIAHDLRSISPFGQTAENLCIALIGLCQPPSVNNFTVPFPKASPSSPINFTSTGRPPFQVGHLSDVHIDLMYTVRCSRINLKYSILILELFSRAVMSIARNLYVAEISQMKLDL